jgi:hypothetical protein
MKKFFFAATLVLVVMTLAVGAADMQTGRAQVRLNLRAGDGGGPIPMCRPGANCGPDDTLRQMAGDGASVKMAPVYLFGEGQAVLFELS